MKTYRIREVNGRQFSRMGELLCQQLGWYKSVTGARRMSFVRDMHENPVELKVTVTDTETGNSVSVSDEGLLEDLLREIYPFVKKGVVYQISGSLQLRCFGDFRFIL